MVAAARVSTEAPVSAATTRAAEAASANAASLEETYARSDAMGATTSAVLPATGKSKWAIDESENLRSTLEHRLWTFGSVALMAGSTAQAAHQAQALGPAGWVGMAAALLASYVLSDLGTGIYHWSVDNYGDGKTPVVGKQIAAFQVRVRDSVRRLTGGRCAMEALCSQDNE